MRGAQIGLDSGAPGLARLPSASQKRGAARSGRPGPAPCPPVRRALGALRAVSRGAVPVRWRPFPAAHSPLRAAGCAWGESGRQLRAVGRCGAVRCVPSCRRSWVRVRVYLGALVPTEPVLASREGFWSSSSCTKYANVLIDRRSWRLLLL